MAFTTSSSFSTLKQDNIIPIYISLQYGAYNFLKFPINPESISKNIASNSTTADIEGLGEISVPTTPKLATITISSFFWQEVNYQQSSTYVAWLEKWQKSKEPAYLIVTRLNYSMQVTCESFRHWINAGEENDIYFELQLKEYRPYGAKKLNVVETKSLIQKAMDLKDTVMDYVPILVDIPRVNRNRVRKLPIENPYIVKEGDTLSSITKKITGYTVGWRKLYNENKDEISKSKFKDLKVGTKLKVPDEWMEKHSLGGVNEL